MTLLLITLLSLTLGFLLGLYAFGWGIEATLKRQGRPTDSFNAWLNHKDAESNE